VVSNFLISSLIFAASSNSKFAAASFISENGPPPLHHHQKNFWKFQLGHGTFWGEEDFKRKAEEFKKSEKKQ
jgi:hypothetical protein